MNVIHIFVFQHFLQLLNLLKKWIPIQDLVVNGVSLKICEGKINRQPSILGRRPKIAECRIAAGDQSRRPSQGSRVTRAGVSPSLLYIHGTTPCLRSVSAKQNSNDKCLVPRSFTLNPFIVSASRYVYYPSLYYKQLDLNTVVKLNKTITLRYSNGISSKYWHFSHIKNRRINLTYYR